jgi:cardiolipin synthase
LQHTGTMLRGTLKPSSAYTHNNKVKLVRGGADYFEVLTELVNKAIRSIHLQIYIMDDDETGQQVAKLLMDAAQRGVAVYLVVDGFASKNLSDDFIQQLRSAGVHFRFFEPLLKSEHFYFGRRLHHKILVTDAWFSLVGGVNISNRYNDLDGQPAWQDWALLTEGPASVEVFKVCIEVWSRPGKIQVRKSLIHEIVPHKPAGHSPVRIRRNDWVKRKNQISGSYIDMLKKASSHVIIMSSYFLPGQILRHHLSRAAKRKIDITVIVAEKSDVRLAKNAERYIYRWLLKRNIKLYEYTRSVMHGKMATRDNKWVTIGSYNVNDISAYASVELNLDVNDTTFASEVQKQLQHIMANDCVQVTEEIFLHKYNFIQRGIQYCSYLLVRVLFYLFTFYFKQR